MKIAIIYKSTFGATKKYALWLQDSLGGDVFTMGQISQDKLDIYDTLVIMSGTYAGRMPLVQYLRTNWKHLQAKNVIVIAVGCIPSEDPHSQASYQLIPPEISAHITYFKLPGKFFQINSSKVLANNLAPILEATRH